MIAFHRYFWILGPISATYHTMGLYEFIALDRDEKSDILWYFGVYLMSRPYLEGMVNLYGLDDFYVEVFYNQELNCIEDIRSFQSVGCLEPYFDSILLNLE